MERLLYLFEKYPLDLLTHLSSLLPIIIGTATYRDHSRNQRYIWLFWIAYFLKETYSLTYVYKAQANIHIQNLEPILYTIFIAYIFFVCFRSVAVRRVILVGAVVVCMVVIASFNRQNPSLYSLLSFRIYAIGLSLAYFNKIIADLRIKNILKHTMFWFASGLLTYATGTFFISLFSDFLFDTTAVDDETFDTYWNLSNIVFIIFALLSAIGLQFSKYDRSNMA